MMGVGVCSNGHQYVGWCSLCDDFPEEVTVVEKPEKSDPVNHPAHYNQYPVEVIEITEHLNFCLGNAVKYILRADYKGEPIQDLEKAVWYLNREIFRRKVSAEEEKLRTQHAQ